jgi:hypothetical protein
MKHVKRRDFLAGSAAVLASKEAQAGFDIFNTFSGGGGGGLPVGLIQSTPLGGGAFTVTLNQSKIGPAPNSDGTTTGWSTGAGTSGSNSGTELQLWWNCPASQYYQFVIPSYCASAQAAPANGLQVWIDQQPIPADGASSVANNWFCQFITNVGTAGVGPSVNYSYTVPVTAGFHSIMIYLCTPSNGNQSGIHCDRLNIIGTGNAFPVEPSPQTRNMIFQPYSSYHFFNTPFGSGATWLALS